MNEKHRSDSEKHVGQGSRTFSPRRDRLFSIHSPKRANCLDEIFSDTSISYLTRIAENSSMPASMLEQLAFHSNASVREAVADNSNTPMDALLTLVCDESSDVRYAMAENHNLPISLLTQLAEDENPYVSSRAKVTIERVYSCGTVLIGAFEFNADDEEDQQAHSA